MSQKQTSTIIVGLAIALAVLAGVIMTVATISEQAYAVGPPSNRGTATAGCASSAQGPAAQGCAIRGP